MPHRFLRRSLAVAAAVVVLGTLVGAVAAAPASALTNCTASSSWGTNRTDLAAQVIGVINQYRAGIGLSQLSVSSSLTASSEWKSLHMAGYNYFAHDDPAPPVTRAAYQRAKDCGFSGTTWGENIAYGYATAQSVVSAWLGSAGHKANIENPSFKTTGVGVAANASGTLYWTQSFGNDGGSAAPPPPPPPPAGGDTQKPTTPTGLAAISSTQASVQLRWNASSDNVGVKSYGIYIGGSLIGSVTGTSVSVSGLQCGRNYAVGADAADAAGNRSGIATLTLATAACSSGGSDAVAPTAPSSVTVMSATRTSISIRWSASADNVGVTSYRVWRGAALLGTTTSTSFSLTGLACGTSYQVGVEAIDAAGNVSPRTLRTVSTRSCFFWY